jgi:hypothetical protein
MTVNPADTVVVKFTLITEFTEAGASLDLAEHTIIDDGPGRI